MSDPRAILILAGGAGTRLWPLSTEDTPKQFLQIFEGASLIQQTFSRFRQRFDPCNLFVSTNSHYAPLVREQLPDLPIENLLLEPARRNTGPAIALCCSEIGRRLPDVTVGVFPSDHFIGNEPEFLTQVERAFTFAENERVLMTVGIEPTEPNTGFGYLELGDELQDGIARVERFVEKPDLKRAQEFLSSGRYLWNGGMFIWKVSYFFDVLEMTAPEIVRLLGQIAAATDADHRDTLYETMPSISIDYAVMEKAPAVATIRGSFAWSDVGSWSAVARLDPTTKQDHVYLAESSGTYVRSDSSKPVIVIGMDDVAVIDSPDGLLVLNLAKSELLSGVVKKLG